MIDSLLRLDSLATIYVYAVDDLVFRYFSRLGNDRIVPVNKADFETSILLRLKKERSVAEYCWTLTPNIIVHAIETFDLPWCVYLDADLYFYSSPAVLLNELSDSSIGLTEHRFPPDLTHLEIYGKYNVQFMFFRQDQDGMVALKWWQSRCNEWCFNRIEDGKFGDQLYLNDWLQRFSNVKVIENIGAGLAPWNVKRYQLYKAEGSVRVREGPHDQPVVFFHFHALKFLSAAFGLTIGYSTTKEAVNLLIVPYAAAVLAKDHSLNRNRSIFSNYRDFKLAAIARDFLKDNYDSKATLFAIPKWTSIHRLKLLTMVVLQRLSSITGRATRVFLKVVFRLARL